MRHISLFQNVYISHVEEKIDYDSLVSTLIREGFNPLRGSSFIKIVEEKQEMISLPQDDCFIVGLEEKKNLEIQKFPDGTILYRFPILYRISRGKDIGKYFLADSCFSESGLVDNFFNTYILSIR